MLPIRILCVLLLASLGCGDDGVGVTYPVSGRVLVAGTPLTPKAGTVVLKPNAARGNTTAFEPAGAINASGEFVVYTKSRRGAPPGWYKVVVAATGETQPSDGTPLSRPMPKHLVPAIYGQEATTTLEIEVVESPPSGAYDLRLDAD
jgi:hypothetical protein